MKDRKKILLIVGSASRNSSNHKLALKLAEQFQDSFEVIIIGDLKQYPHFDPELSVAGTPAVVETFREQVRDAVGVIISTPEYVFSVPSGLKNLIEWCVSTTVFSGKPVGVVTASAGGEKGHEELKMLLRTLMAGLSEETSLLIGGIKSKFDEQGEIKDSRTRDALEKLVTAFRRMLISQAD